MNSADSASADGEEDTFVTVSAAVNAGILSLVGDSVDVGKTLTKSETALILCRIEDYMTANNMRSDDN